MPLRNRATPSRPGRHRRIVEPACRPRVGVSNVPQGTGHRRRDGWTSSRDRRIGAAGDREERDHFRPARAEQARGSRGIRVGAGQGREVDGRMSWAMECGSRAWRPRSPPVERASSAGPGVGGACGAGPPEAGSGSRLPRGRRPSGGTREVGEKVGDRRARRSDKSREVLGPHEASGSPLSRPDNGRSQDRP